MPKIVQRVEQKPWENQIITYARKNKLSTLVAGRKLKAKASDISFAVNLRNAWDERVDGMILQAIDISRGVRWGK